MIVIVFWAVEINLVYFAQKRWLICDCNSFLGCHPLVAVNNLVYLPGDRSDYSSLTSRHIVVIVL